MTKPNNIQKSNVRSTSRSLASGKPMPDTTASDAASTHAMFTTSKTRGTVTPMKEWVRVFERHRVRPVRIDEVKIERRVWGISGDVLSFDGQCTIERLANLHQLVDERAER